MREFARLLEGPIFWSCQKLSSKLYQCTFCCGLLEIKYLTPLLIIMQIILLKWYLQKSIWEPGVNLLKFFANGVILMSLLSTLSKWMPAGYEQQP